MGEFSAVSQKEAYTVSQVTGYIKNIFEKDMLLNRVSIKGEVSNCKYHTSGHIYFTLKDGTSQIACVMFAGARAGLNFRMREGDGVIASGSIRVYERDGKYQLYAQRIVLDGVGQLYERLEQLKGKLREAGYFDMEHKKPLPVFPKKIGVVTAGTGAALQDICNIARRRNPFIQLVLAPAQVQGFGAAESVARGIKRLDRYGVDLIIVARGGGSIEDLWAFNEEIVVRAAYACVAPIVSGVGHETDVTLIDYVADLRAPTPSAAAELAVFEIAALDGKLAGCHERLTRAMFGVIRGYREAALAKADRLALENPRRGLAQKKESLAYRKERLKCRMDGIVKERRGRLAGVPESLLRTVRGAVEKKRQRLKIAAARLEGVSPLARFAKGYSYVSSEEKGVVSVNDVKKGGELVVTVRDGEIFAKVTGIKPGGYIKEEEDNKLLRN
ncbi:MAG: exodeoxyribonuclease VII large subunit [Lachnospiraceae bacterium]|nr:exodeoxyribonuclease VII large subunit [Lachnospiraceae bacterium]